MKKPYTSSYKSIYDSFNKITYVDTECIPDIDQSDRGSIFSPYQYAQDALYYETEDVMLCIAGGNYPVVARGIGVDSSQQSLIIIPFNPQGNGRRVLFCSCFGTVNFLATTAPPPSSGNILKMAPHAAMSRSIELYSIVEKKMTANRTNQKFSKMCVLQ